MGAGVLLRSRNESGQLVCLLSREADTGEWRDLGGSPEGKEGPLDTACREASEESNGLLGSANDVKKMIKRRSGRVIVSEAGRYTTYVVDVPFSSLKSFTSYFNNSIRFLDAHFDCARRTEGLMEKTRARMVNLAQAKRLAVPKWYRSVVITALGGKSASRN